MLAHAKKEKGWFGSRRSKKGKLGWQNEKAPGLAEIPEEDDKPFTRMLQEMKKKEAEGSTLEKGPLVETKAEPLEKGNAEAAASTPEPFKKAPTPEPFKKGNC